MMNASIPEVDTLVKHQVQVVLSIKNPESLAISLCSERILRQEHTNAVCSLPLSMELKAQSLLSCVIEEVKKKPAKFLEFVEVLKSSQPGATEVAYLLLSSCMECKFKNSPAVAITEPPNNTCMQPNCTVPINTDVVSTENEPCSQQEEKGIHLTVEEHYSALCYILEVHATKWRDIGQYLGFLPGELDNIQGSPLLLQTAPISWLNTMIEKFLQDKYKRRVEERIYSTKTKLETLETALKKTGLGAAASQLKDEIQRLKISPRVKMSSVATSYSGSSAVQKYASHLKGIYSKRKMPDYLKGRQLQSKRYVELALVHRKEMSKKEMDEFTRSTVQGGDIDAILKQKTPLKMSEIGKLEDGSLATCMLLLGGPGVGKTTLAWVLCRAWKSGELFQQYSLVVFIQLRKKRIQEAQELKDLFSIGDSDAEAVSQEIQRIKGKSVLLIFDGYDELPEDVQQDSLIAEIVCGDRLPEASVLVTCRPSSCDTLYDKCSCREGFQHIEVLGFTESNIEDYIKQNVDSKRLSQFQEYLSSHPKILSMLYNPLQCALTVEVCKRMFRDSSDLPNTRSKLYEMNILMTMSREQSTLSRISRLQKLPSSVHECFVKLCKLAYSGIVERQIIFEDVPEEVTQLGLLICEPDLYSVLPSLETYTFFHLTIQEFCATYYISTLDKCEQEVLLEEICDKPHFREIIIFLFGIAINPAEVLDVVLPFYETNDICFLLHCASESQDCETCTSLIEKLHSSIDISYKNLNPMDMFVMGFVVAKSKRVTTKLKLYCCDCGPKELDAFLVQVRCTLGKFSKLGIEEINLIGNKIGPDGARCLAEGLQYSPILQKVYLSENDIGPIGIKFIASGLRYCPEMKKLDISKNSVGPDGAQWLAEGLRYCPKLQEIDLSRNSISPDGAKSFARGLQYCPELRKLYLFENDIGPEGTKSIAEGLQYVPKLQGLFLFQNNIGPEGTKFLADGLRYTPEIQRLGLSRNNISYEGMKSLADALQCCSKFERLFLFCNNIGSNGAKCLGEALQYCPNIKELNLFQNNIGPHGAKWLAEGLRHCPELQSLDLSENKIGVDGTQSLADGLLYHPKLQGLFLADNNIGTNGAKCLAECLHYCLELQKLDVCSNGISEEGRAALEKLAQEMNLKRGSNGDRLTITF